MGRRSEGGGIIQLFFGTLAVLLLFAIVLSWAGGRNKRTETADPLAGARHACREFIGASLHDPAAAEWGEYWNWTVTTNADSTHSVGARFQAKNGFGALRSSYVTCIIRNEGDSWRLVKLSRMQ